MCIAILKLVGSVSLTDKELASCKANNPDGFGYAFIDGGKVIVKKYMGYDEFKYCYREDEMKHHDSPFLIHFRATSAGTTTVENCHPFSVTDKQAFIHNGTMFSVPAGSTESDTNLFNKNILQHLPEDWTENTGMLNLVRSFVSPGKIVVLNADGSYLICGEAHGHWREGIWFSNKDYEENRRVTVFNEAYYYKKDVSLTKEYKRYKKREEERENNKTSVKISGNNFTCQNCFNVFPLTALDSMSWGDRDYELCPDCKKEWENFS